MNITEEQKKIIESYGCMVIEFKMWIIKTAKVVVDVMESIAEWIAEFMTVHVVPILHDVFDNICILNDSLEKINEIYIRLPRTMHPKERSHKAVQLYFKAIKHRARSNC